MYSLSKFVMTACLALLPVMTATAQEENPDGKAVGAAEAKAEPAVETEEIELEPLYVTVKRTDQAELEVARSLTVLGRRDLEIQNPASLPDLMDEVPGVEVQKTNGGAGAPIIRGMIGPENLIVVDGVRFNNSTFRTGPNQYLALIDPWSLSSVEILRGPGSAMFGGDAMGGVVNLTTLAPRALLDRHLGTGGHISAGSPCLNGCGSVQLDLDAGPVGGYLGGTHMVFSELRAGGGEIQPLSDYLTGNLRYKTSVKLNDRWTLTDALFWNMVLGAGRTDDLGKGEHRNYDNQDVLTYVLIQRQGAGLGHSLKINVSYHYTNEVQTRYWCQTDDNGHPVDRAACIAAKQADLTKRRLNEDTVSTPGFYATWEPRFWQDRIRLVVGADGYFDFVSSTQDDAKASEDWEWKEKDRGSFSDGSRYFMIGAFVTGSIDFVRFRNDSAFNLSGAVRLNYINAFAPDVPGVGDVSYDHTGVAGSASLSYVIRDRLNIYFDWSQGFRAPNLQETTVMGDTGTSFEVPNDSLEPQKSNTLEAGLKVNTKLFRANAAGFYTWLEDGFVREDLSQAEWEALGLTEEEVGDRPVQRRVNAQEAAYRGIEGGMALGPFAGLTLWGNVGWVLGDVTNREGEQEPAQRVPPLSGSAGMRWDSKRWRLFVEFYIKWAAKQDRLSPNDEKDLRICEDPNNPGKTLAECSGTPGWVTYNLRAGIAPRDWMNLNLSIENLADAKYKYHGSGLYAPGLTVIAGLAVKY
jgi:outer membrane receptor protein involved in Fe transport